RSRPRRNRGECPTRPLSPQHLQRISNTRTGEQRANDTDRYVLTAQPGKSQGRPLKQHGLEAHRANRPAQHALSQGPWPSATEPKPEPTRPATSTRHSHAPKLSSPPLPKSRGSSSEPGA